MGLPLNTGEVGILVICISLKSPDSPWWGNYNIPHFIDEETEAQWSLLEKYGR